MGAKWWYINLIWISLNFRKGGCFTRGWFSISVTYCLNHPFYFILTFVSWALVFGSVLMNLYKSFICFWCLPIIYFKYFYYLTWLLEIEFYQSTFSVAWMIKIIFINAFIPFSPNFPIIRSSRRSSLPFNPLTVYYGSRIEV